MRSCVFSGKCGGSDTALTRHVVLFAMLGVLFFAGKTAARPIEPGRARRCASGWLRQHRRPMDRPISGRLESFESIVDPNLGSLCFVIHLEPEGFMVVAADDEVNPVIAFSSTGYIDASADNPLRVLLKNDMKGRLTSVRQKLPRSLRRTQQRDRWQRYTDMPAEAQLGSDDPEQSAAPSLISDVYVAPLTQTEWGQTNADGDWCYNYYTPSHYPCGCVATAMAQLMHYHRWPEAGIGGGYLGGDGAGGPYDWDQMPDVPEDGLTTAQRRIIGRLCKDAGLSVDMDYSPGVSIANLYDTDKVLVSTFMYSNSIYTANVNTYSHNYLWVMMNSNLDAGLPVLLAISRDQGAHAIIADGYGYQEGLLYHHLNMGWDGLDDAWYQLPDVDTSLRDYDTVTKCVYNIYPEGTGEIISGRVTNTAGVPYEGVLVTAWRDSAPVGQALTNYRGVYALVHLASYTDYQISAEHDNLSFTSQIVTTGRSRDGAAVSGNRWPVNFMLSGAFGPPVALDAVVDVNSWEVTTVPLCAIDEDPFDPNNPCDPNLYAYIITSLPLHCELSEPNIGIIRTVPHPLLNDVNHVVAIMPCPYFSGEDSFTFKLNDGGTYPTGGESNIATVTVQVNNVMQTGFGAEPNEAVLMLDTASFCDLRSQVIYLNSDIGPARLLLEMSLHVAEAPGQPIKDWTVRMQHIEQVRFDDVNDLPSQFLTGGWTTVYQGSMPDGTGWLSFPFDTPFYYNGQQPLLIDFSFNNDACAGPAGRYYVRCVSSDRVLSLASAAGIHGDPLSWNFWSLGGDYYLNGDVPSIRLIGEIVSELEGDFDVSCDVTLPDLAIFSQAWQLSSGDPGYNPDCDLTDVKGVIDLQDLIIFSEQWLSRYW